MWLFWLALLIAVAFGCSFLAPSSDLHASALRAFDASVSMLSRGDIESTLSDGGEGGDEGVTEGDCDEEREPTEPHLFSSPAACS